MPDTWIRTTRPRLLLPALALGLVAAGLAAPASAGKPSATVKGYTATATPSVVPLPLPATGASVVLALTNTAGTQAFASAELRVREGTGLDLAAASVSRTGWSLGPAATGGGQVVVQLVSSGAGTTNAVGPGQRIDVVIPVRAVEGAVQVETDVKQSNDFSGTGNDFTPSGPDPTVHIGAGPAVGLRFVQQPSTVQRTGTATSYPGLTPVLSMCPAPSVRVVDAQGTTVRSGSARTVRLAAPDAGLGGTREAVTVDGVATFGSCPVGVTGSTLGSGILATASTTGLATITSAPFDVRPIYGSCPATCSVPELTGGQGTTRASMAAVPGDEGASSADRLTFGVDLDTWSDGDLAACDPDPETTNGANPYREVVTVDLSNHDKTVQLRWTKRAVQWATNNGSSQWRVCLAAAAPFAAVGGPAVSVAGWWVGALLPCGDPALAAADPCVASLKRNGGEQLATVRIPDRPGDPRMI